MSSTGAPTPSSSSTAGKAPRILACALCQHRKIKCDRNTPCSNCIKANVACTPSTPAPARKRRRPNQDLQERLARCEELLKTYAEAASESPTSGTSSSIISRDPSKYPEPLLPLPPAGKVVVEDGSTRFVDSFLWNNIHDELTKMRKIIEADEVEEHSNLASEAPTPDDATDLLLGDYANLSLDDAYPEPVHVFRLWQIFLERVNPLFKIVHVPSVQPYVVEVASGNWNIPPNYQPLLFSMFNIAVFALSEPECRQMLGVSREAALKKLSSGVRAALMRVNFMKTYDLCILQALSLYLLSLQGRQNRHASWILSGVAVRIAQKMGLHRDGESLKLTPFETEMRRRLWWQVITQDAKCALMSGLTYQLVSINWDTKLPRNMNDAELFPGSLEPIQERDGPTEMGFSLLMLAVWRFVIKCHQEFPAFEAVVLGFDVEAAGTKDKYFADSIDQYKVLVESLEDELRQIQDKYLDPGAGASHFVASKLPANMSKKLRELYIPYTEIAEYGTEVFNIKDNLFRLGVYNLESTSELYELLDSKGFIWFCKLHFQVEMLTALAGQLIQRPTGTLVDRAWAGVGKMYRYHGELYDMSQKSHVTLRSFVLKAWRVRAQALAQQGLMISTPVCVQELMKGLPEGRMSETTTPASIASSTAGMMGHSVANASSSRESSKNSNTWEYTPGQRDSVPTGEAGLGGLMDMDSIDWDMFANSMTQEQGGAGAPGFGFGGLGANIGPPW